MQIFHPPQAVNGMSPENVFYVADSANQTIAEGFIIPTYHPHLFPERPVNLYMSIRGHDAGKDMLLGALLARVRQLHEQTANMPARVFTQVNPEDQVMLDFYQESGFDMQDALEVVRLGIPNARPSAPMGYNMQYVPITNQGELNGFIQRMNNYRLNVLQPNLVQRYMSLPHFFALCLLRGDEIVGEIAFTGDGQLAKMIGLYIKPNYRRMGLAKSLIALGMKLLADRNVQIVEADVIRRNEAQCALARACFARNIRVACYYPGLNYD